MLRFLDANGNVIPAADIPEYASGTIIPGRDPGEDAATSRNRYYAEDLDNCGDVASP
jgi:hypothetical protein